ncbi:MAG: hypothetical protein IPL79_03100 [Myxococcales bacterium]|nr:hypothetical protein [Myxococcales bacterium]
MAGLRRQGWARVLTAVNAATIGVLASLLSCETLPRTTWQPAGDAQVAGDAATASDAAVAPALPAATTAELTVVVAGDPGNFRLVESASAAARLIAMGSVFEPLIAFDREADAYVPRLALTWTANDAGRDWTISLRAATFHDGTPVTARDVQFSLDSARTIATQYKGQLATVTSITVVDAQTVRVRTDVPDGYLLRVLCEIPIVPAHVYGKRGAVPLPIGSGPFKVTSRQAGELRAARYDNYWGAPAGVASLHFRFSRDARQLGEWIASKTTDMALGLPASLAEAVAARGLVPLELAPRLRYAVLRADKPPLDDPRVRRALSAFIDRTSQTGAALRNDVPINSLAWPGGPLDVESSQVVAGAPASLGSDLLAQAGWVDTNRDGLRDRAGQVLRVNALFVDRGTTSRQRWPDEAAPLIAAWKAAGIGVEMTFAPESVVQTRLRNGAFGVAVVETEVWRDADLTAMLGTGGSQNLGRFSSPQSDVLLRELRASQRPEARRATAALLARELAEQMPIVPLARSAGRGAFAASLAGVAARGGWVDFAKVTRRPGPINQ